MGEKRVDTVIHTPMGPAITSCSCSFTWEIQTTRRAAYARIVAGAAPYSGHFLLFRKVYVPYATLLAALYHGIMFLPHCVHIATLRTHRIPAHATHGCASCVHCVVLAGMVLITSVTLTNLTSNLLPYKFPSLSLQPAIHS